MDYLNQSPKFDSISSPLSTTGFERALTPGIKTPIKNEEIKKSQDLKFNSDLESPLSSPLSISNSNSTQQNKNQEINAKSQNQQIQNETKNNSLSNLSFKRKKINTKTSQEKTNNSKSKSLKQNSKSKKKEEIKIKNNPSSSPNHQNNQTGDSFNQNQNSNSNSNQNQNSNSKNKKSSTKKPIKSSSKKLIKPSNITPIPSHKLNSNTTTTTTPSVLSTPATTNNFINSSTTSSNIGPLNHFQKTKQSNEYDLNNPQTWGALFGGGDKKPAAKPIKPGNLPPQAALSYNGKSIDRLEARKKQRLEEKRALLCHSEVGFDLLRQNLVMMDFEIEYKNHVRAMVEKPLELDSSLDEHNKKPPSSHSSNMENANQEIRLDSTDNTAGTLPIPDSEGRNVLVRSDGYRRYLNPNSNPSDQNPPPIGFQVQQPPGPIYSSSFPRTSDPEYNLLHRKVLPRPGMFGSSFFIWQSHHLS